MQAAFSPVHRDCETKIPLEQHGKKKGIGCAPVCRQMFGLGSKQNLSAKKDKKN